MTVSTSTSTAREEALLERIMQAGAPRRPVRTLLTDGTCYATIHGYWAPTPPQHGDHVYAFPLLPAPDAQRHHREGFA